MPCVAFCEHLRAALAVCIRDFAKNRFPRDDLNKHLAKAAETEQKRRQDLAAAIQTTEEERAEMQRKEEELKVQLVVMQREGEKLEAHLYALKVGV